MSRAAPVPGAPGIFSQLRAQPQVNINLDVQARRVQDGQNIFEVSLMIRAEAHQAEQGGNGQAAPTPTTVFVAASITETSGDPPKLTT